MPQRRETLRAHGPVRNDPFWWSGGVFGDGEVKQQIHIVEIDGTQPGVLIEWAVLSCALPGVADCNTGVFDALEDLERVAIWGRYAEGSV